MHNQWKPPRSRTCYRGVVSFAARLEADAYVAAPCASALLGHAPDAAARIFSSVPCPSFFTRRAKKDRWAPALSPTVTHVASVSRGNLWRVTTVSCVSRLEYKYEVSARRPFFYPADAIIWHETARQCVAWGLRWLVAVRTCPCERGGLRLTSC